MKNYLQYPFISIVIFICTQMPLLAQGYWDPDADRDSDYHGYDNSIPDGVEIFTLVIAICISLYLFIKDWHEMNMAWLLKIIWFFFVTGLIAGLLIYPMWGLYGLLNLINKILY